MASYFTLRHHSPLTHLAATFTILGENIFNGFLLRAGICASQSVCKHGPTGYVAKYVPNLHCLDMKLHSANGTEEAGALEHPHLSSRVRGRLVFFSSLWPDRFHRPTSEKKSDLHTLDPST